MSQSSRPGGLTTLAIINFVWAGLSCLGLLVIITGITMIKTAAGALEEAAVNDPSIDALGPQALTSLYVGLFSYLVVITLLIISGIGYLGLKKTLGYKMGNLYGIVSIITSIISIMIASEKFGLWGVIGFIYPALTLLLLNTTFKEDFVN